MLQKTLTPGLNYWLLQLSWPTRRPPNFTALARLDWKHSVLIWLTMAKLHSMQYFVKRIAFWLPDNYPALTGGFLYSKHYWHLSVPGRTLKSFEIGNVHLFSIEKLCSTGANMSEKKLAFSLFFFFLHVNTCSRVCMLSFLHLVVPPRELSISRTLEYS